MTGLGADDADHIGLTEPGESWKAIENGEIEIGGVLPINPSGGLIGGGHPVKHDLKSGTEGTVFTRGRRLWQ